LHPWDQHRNGYDFTVLVQAQPTLSQYVRPNAYGDDSIDFANPQAVKALNQALLKHYYGVAMWDIPKITDVCLSLGGLIMSIIWRIYWQRSA